VQWDDLRRWRRRTRHHLQVRRWPLHRKIAVGAWVPVVIVGLALFTGPNRSSSTSSALPVTTTTQLRMKPIPRSTTTIAPVGTRSQDEVIGSWILAVPPKKTVPQQREVRRFRAIRDRAILALHKATEKAHSDLIHQNDKAILGH
jgi:hypothetical protein